jgi:hypothetical protein
MYELKKIEKIVKSKFVGNGPSFYKKIIYRAAVSQRLRSSDVENLKKIPPQYRKLSYAHGEKFIKVNN